MERPLLDSEAVFRCAKLNVSEAPKAVVRTMVRTARVDPYWTFLQRPRGDQQCMSPLAGVALQLNCVLLEFGGNFQNPATTCTGADRTG